MLKTHGRQGKSDRGSVSSWRGFRYAMCNESMQGMDWEEQCDLVAKAGYQGIEVAPFSLVKEGVGELTPQKRKAMVDSMQNAGIECA
jgi:sugar phosphate isomerase/epimerase